MSEENVELVGNRAKSFGEMCVFLERLVGNRSLEVYSLIIDAPTVVEESDDHKLIRVDKGAKLVKVKKLPSYPSHSFVRYIKNNYLYNLYFDTKFKGIYPDKGITTVSCSLEKLADSSVLRKVSSEYGKIIIPADCIAGKLLLQKIIPFKVPYDIQCGEDIILKYEYKKVTKITVSGERDAFFDRVIEFFKS